jgi:hypothetical protein
MFKPSMPHTVFRCLEIVVLHAIGFYLLFNGRMGAGLAILGLASGRLVTYRHTYVYYACTYIFICIYI